jgi:type VI secretion system secreted protein VgrG
MDTRPLSAFFQAGPLESSDVTALRVERRLGQVAVAEVDVRTTTYAEPDDLLGAPARLAFGRGQADHEMIGVVTSVGMVATPGDDFHDHLVYRLTVGSSLELLSQQVDCRIFQDKDVKEIVSGVLTDFGIADGQQSWRLSANYPKREYCVQYNESALAFVSRLLEEEGIFFFSDKGDDGELLVFEDDSTTADPIDGNKSLEYQHGGGLEASDDAVGVITQRHRTATGKVTLRDYDWKRPSLDMTVTASADADADLEVYDYPGLYVEPADGQRLAEVKLEAMQAERVTLDLVAGCPRLLAGRWLTLENTPIDVDGDYLCTGVVHEMKGGVYQAHATVIPKKVKYRTPQRTPRPIIDGPQTAVIVAPPGSPHEEIHTDKHGRVKVRFHWDRYAKDDDTASCWMRTSQQQTSGSMILPRVGWEVVVEFLEGNPDRPIVTGRMYNGKFMPPYALPEGKSRTALQTSSSPGGTGINSIRMEDKAGSEEVKIASQKDTTLATANNKTTSVANNATKIVKVSSTLSVGADQTVKVTNGYKDTVGAAQSTSVGGNRTLEVNAVYGLTSGGASTTSVGGNQFEMDGDPLQALLALAVRAATDAARAEAAQAMQQLDQAVSSRVNDVMGPINGVIGQANQVGAAMNAVSQGDLGAAASAVSAASGMPMPSAVGAAMQAASGGGGSGGGGEGGGSGGPVPTIPTVSLDHASSQLGLDRLVNGAIDAGAGALGSALGLGGGGGGGESGANAAGPSGAAGSNSDSDTATGPGHAIHECSSTHSEKVGSLKATIAAAGIHTTINGARTHKIGAARVELVGGTRAETCLAGKTENAVGLVVISKAAEEETAGGARTTMVGGAILEKIGGSHTVTASGKALFVGAFHQIDASESISFKCGDSEVVINGDGVAIKTPGAVTITAPDVTLTKSVTEA